MRFLDTYTNKIIYFYFGIIFTVSTQVYQLVEAGQLPKSLIIGISSCSIFYWFFSGGKRVIELSKKYSEGFFTRCVFGVLILAILLFFVLQDSNFLPKHIKNYEAKLFFTLSFLFGITSLATFWFDFVDRELTNLVKEQGSGNEKFIKWHGGVLFFFMFLSIGMGYIGGKYLN